MMLTSSFLGARPVAPMMAAARPSIAGAGNASRQVTCMAKKKASSKGRLIVTLECTEARGEGATPTRYTSQKNKKNTPERLELKKYNKHLRRVTLHREIK